MPLEIKSTANIPETHKDLLEKAICVVLVTVMADGQPQASVVWCNYDGTHIKVNYDRLKGGSLEERRAEPPPESCAAESRRFVPPIALPLRGRLKAVYSDNQHSAGAAQRKKYESASDGDHSGHGPHDTIVAG